MKVVKTFNPKEIKKLYKPAPNSKGEDNGQVTLIGGSSLFHGAPILSLKVASRIVDMVIFSSPEKSLEEVATKIKSSLMSFIWVPWEEVEEYIKKSDAILIGPGFMRYKNENTINHTSINKNDESYLITKKTTSHLLKKYPNKKWVIDAGSLQVIDKEEIPKGSIITPNEKEYKILFNTKNPSEMAKKLGCTLVLKGKETKVYEGTQEIVVKGGNAGLTKGGTGDVQAGLTTALFAKNPAFLSASVASFLIKKASEDLFAKVGLNFNADDLANQVPITLKRYS